MRGEKVTYKQAEVNNMGMNITPLLSYLDHLKKKLPKKGIFNFENKFLSFNVMSVTQQDYYISTQ